MKKLSLIFVCLLALGVALHADIYIKSNVHTDAFAMMGQNQPAKDTVQEQWFSDNAVAMMLHVNCSPRDISWGAAGATAFRDLAAGAVSGAALELAGSVGDNLRMISANTIAIVIGAPTAVAAMNAARNACVGSDMLADKDGTTC